MSDKLPDLSSDDKQKIKDVVIISTPSVSDNLSSELNSVISKLTERLVEVPSFSNEDILKVRQQVFDGIIIPPKNESKSEETQENILEQNEEHYKFIKGSEKEKEKLEKGNAKLLKSLVDKESETQKSLDSSQTKNQERQIALQRAKSQTEDQNDIISVEKNKESGKSKEKEKKESKGFLSSLFGGGGGGKGAGGLLGGLGAGALKVGVGGGALAAGLGVFAGGSGYLLKQMGEMDADLIKKNVLTILSIGDEFKYGSIEVFAKGGPLIMTLTGLGSALSLFSVGSGFAAGVDKFSGKSNFAENIKQNVISLLGISDVVGKDAGKKMLTLASTLGLLGGALAVFSTGTAISAGVNYFSADSDFAESIKQNVEKLLSIANLIKNDMTTKMIALPLTLGLLGAGLTSFSAGSGVSAAVNYFSSDSDFAKNIKEKVVTLLSIANHLKNDMATKMIALPLTLGLLGAGLAVFSTGAAVGAAVDLFSGGSNWAENIKQSVITLLSISDSLGGAASFIGGSAVFLPAMTGIAAGLAVFGIGSAAGGILQGISDGLAFFTSGQDSASLIKSRVLTLLSISESLGGAADFIGKSAVFLTAMTGIAAGLAVFGIGAGAAGILQGLSDGLAFFTDSTDSAELIKSRVGTLMSILDDFGGAGALIGKSVVFLTAMTTLAAGLAVFGVGNAVNTVLSGGLGTSLTDLASGFGAIGEIDGMNLISVAAGIAAIGPAMGIFFGAKGIGDFVKGGVEKISGVVSKLNPMNWFGGKDAKEAKKGNIFTEMIDTLKPLQEIDGSKFEDFIKVIDSIEKFTSSLEKLSNVNTLVIKSKIGKLNDNFSKLNIPEGLKSKIDEAMSSQQLSGLDAENLKSITVGQDSRKVAELEQIKISEQTLKDLDNNMKLGQDKGNIQQINSNVGGSQKINIYEKNIQYNPLAEKPVW